MSNKTIDEEDVDDVIEIATDIAERERKQAGKLGVDDVVDIGRQVGLEEDHVEQAVDELEHREAAAKADAVRRARTRKIAAAVAAGVFVVLLIWGLTARSGMKDRLAVAKKARAQVVRVVQRQADVVAQWGNRPDSRDKDAEISGARNRVAIEARRYDEAATIYNDNASGIWASVFGLPTELPLSSEIESW